MLRRQRRVGVVLSLPRAVAAIMAATALAMLSACGGSDESAPHEEQAVVARAVAPPPVEGEGTPTPVATASGLPEAESPEDANALPTAPADADDGTGEPPTPTPARPRPRPAGGAILSPADRSSFTRLATQLGGASGLSVSGVGRGRKVEHVGSISSVIAWSTAKVPIAMAVIDAGGQGSQQSSLSAAITASDNAAASRLWASLGPPQAAADAADAELRRWGDAHTQYETRTLRGGLTPFGQTVWTLNDQARFTAGMPCSASGQAVLGLMGQVIPSQRWGLGSIGSGAKLKGGWGPGSQPGQSGGYLNRQMGIVTLSGRQLAVSIATAPADGSHESGTRNLTAIARWLAAHADARTQPASPAC